MGPIFWQCFASPNLAKTPLFKGVQNKTDKNASNKIVPLILCGLCKSDQASPSTFVGTTWLAAVQAPASLARNPKCAFGKVKESFRCLWICVDFPYYLIFASWRYVDVRRPGRHELTSICVCLSGIFSWYLLVLFELPCCASIAAKARKSIVRFSTILLCQFRILQTQNLKSHVVFFQTQQKQKEQPKLIEPWHEHHKCQCGSFGVDLNLCQSLGASPINGLNRIRSTRNCKSHPAWPCSAS